MPQSKPNQIARMLAVFALVAAFILVIATIATSGDDSNDDNTKTDKVERGGPNTRGERAVEDGVWVVKEGDTLVSIADETGIELDELLALNPDLDPQVLTTGQRISLRLGDAADTTGTDRDSTGTDTTTGADEFGDGSVDNSGSSDGISSP